jgi:hypothetical protein
MSFRTILALLITVPMALGTRQSPALQPNPMHIGLKPVLGWSSWSSFRGNATAAKDEAVARAMVSSGLAKLGYRYINQDDGWYVCPGGFAPPGGKPVSRQPPTVDQWGRWIPNDSFPAHGSTNGIKALADYVHSLGLKFGIYLTPGISKEAVMKNTPVEGSVGGHLTGKPSGYTAAQIATRTNEQNYNCGGSDGDHDAGGMVGLNFASPGAQLFVNAWADTLASWGVDFIKLDGVRYPTDVPELKAWALALRQTGRPINFDATEGYTVKIAPALEKYANQWEEAEDIECYSCDKGADHDQTFPLTDAFPLTEWSDSTEASNFGGPSKVVSRFNYAAVWQPYAHGGFNDLDSVEVGNGSDDGISLSARQTVLSLWSLAASPLLLGSDPRYFAPEDLALLKNRAVLAVDQDGIAARRIRNTATEQVFAKREHQGDVIVGLFNTSTTNAQEISIAPSAIGLPAACTAYTLEDLWSHRMSRTSGQITASVPPEGVALFRVRARCH